jgi:hypothetical protein
MDLSQRVGTDWAALLDDVQSKRLARLEAHVAASLALPNVHYRMVQRSLDEFCFRQVRALRRARRPARGRQQSPGRSRRASMGRRLRCRCAAPAAASDAPLSTSLFHVMSCHALFAAPQGEAHAFLKKAFPASSFCVQLCCLHLATTGHALHSAGQCWEETAPVAAGDARAAHRLRPLRSAPGGSQHAPHAP